MGDFGLFVFRYGFLVHSIAKLILLTDWAEEGKNKAFRALIFGIKLHNEQRHLC